jgi:hypothetical protein
MEIKNYINSNKKYLENNKIALVYWDSHFDNILVKNNEIV